MAIISQQIDSRVSITIDGYIKEGVTKVVEMQRLIEIFVKNDLFGCDNLPDQNNRRFYPRSLVIRSIIYRTTKTLKKSMINQECLIDKIEQWKTEDRSAKSHFRPKCLTEKEPLEKEETSCENENSDNENDNEEIQLKGKKLSLSFLTPGEMVFNY